MAVSANLSLTIENIISTLNFNYQEMFHGKATVNADTQPITMGSVSEPEVIIVIAEQPGTRFTIGAGTEEIGAHPFGVWADVGGTPNASNTISVAGNGECVILAYGNA